MKKIVFFAAFAAIAMLASCAEKPVTPAGDAAPARITISIDNPAMTRVIDIDEVDADSKINDLIVFITRDEAGTFDVNPYFVNGATIENDTFTVPATTKADKVYIVANTGPIADGPFAGVANMAEVRSACAKIDGSEGGNAVVAGNVWMSGQSDEIEDAGVVNNVRQLQAEVQLYYIPAKVFVITVNNMENYNGGNGKLKLEGVTITNAGTWTGFIMSNPDAEFSKTVRPDFTTENWEVPYYFNGVEIVDSPFSYGDYYDYDALTGENPAKNYAVNAKYQSRKNFEYIQTAGGATTHNLNRGDAYDLDDADAFYILPAFDGNMVWASIYGTYKADADAAGDQKFWNAAFGGTDAATTNLIELKSGNKYILTLTMAGDANRDNPGEDDPTIETIDAELNIKVLLAEWNVVMAGKTFD